MMSLNRQGCRLGKQVQLPYTHSKTVSQPHFYLVHSEVGGPSPFASIGGHHLDIYFISSRSEVLSMSVLLPWFILSFLRLFLCSVMTLMESIFPKLLRGILA